MLRLLDNILSFLFIEMKTITLKNIRAVGMHHYGHRELVVGEIYQLNAEPTNPYDHNAIAIYDSSRKVGNLKKASASAISDVYKLNLADLNFEYKPLSSPQCSNKRTGPEQNGIATFKCTSTDVEKVKNAVDRHLSVWMSIK